MVFFGVRFSGATWRSSLPHRPPELLDVLRAGRGHVGIHGIHDITKFDCDVFAGIYVCLMIYIYIYIHIYMYVCVYIYTAIIYIFVYIHTCGHKQHYIQCIHVYMCISTKGP